jgi:hypothetical protein
MRVERLRGRSSERHVGPLEEVHILEGRAEVVVSDSASPPRHKSHHGRFPVLDVIAVMNDIAAADRTDSRVGRKPRSDRLQPVGSGYGIVIRDGDELAAGGRASAVQRRHLSRAIHAQHADSAIRLGNGRATLVIVSAQDHEDLQRLERLRCEGTKAQPERVRPTVARHHDRQSRDYSLARRGRGRRVAVRLMTSIVGSRQISE